jgi:hypothetical protein
MPRRASNTSAGSWQAAMQFHTQPSTAWRQHISTIAANFRVESPLVLSGGSMRGTLKIFLAKVHFDDTAAVKSLLLQIQDYGNLVKMLSERQSGFSYAYEQETRIGRFIASNGATMMSFSVPGVTRQEAASIAEECERIAVWNMYEIRKAADRALGTSLQTRAVITHTWLRREAKKQEPTAAQ